MRNYFATLKLLLDAGLQWAEAHQIARECSRA